MPEKITEEMKVHEKWYEEAHAEDISLETLPKFLKHLMEDYEHDYGTVCHALAAGAIATMWAMNRAPQGGITGFQAGCIMWCFIQKWMHYEDPLRLIRFEDMLYPQCEHKFEKTIGEDTWKWLQEEAGKKMKAEGSAHPDVMEHWMAIANGNIPFGYKVKENGE